MDVARVNSSVALGRGKLKNDYLMPGELDALTRASKTGSTPLATIGSIGRSVAGTGSYIWY